MNTLFSGITLSGWRQFRDLEIEFHDRVTILTGANGAGKSTILKILKCHFDYENDEKFLATPIKKDGKTSFLLGSWISTYLDTIFNRSKAQTAGQVGTISYSNGQVCNLNLPPQESISFSLTRSTSVPVSGINISSHRPTIKYEEIKSLSISGVKPADAYKDYFEVQRSFLEQQHYFKNGVMKNGNPLHSLKEAIISFATFGIGNKFVAPIPELVGLYEEFQDVLRKVLPVEIGFDRLEIRTPEVIVISSSGEFPIDGASGGLMSIIQLSWQIFLYSKIDSGSRFMVLLDEPENHLHPSMQRTFLSNIVSSFPTARFVVATHSPFIISSIKEANVFALRHHTSDGSNLRPLEPRSVDSHKLDHVQRAGPASDVLREVLGVPVTIPEWSAQKLDEIAAEFSQKEINQASLNLLRQRLEDAGLSEFYPYAVERVIK